MPELSQNRLETQDHLWEGPPQEVAGPLPIYLLSPHPPALLPLLAACLGGDPLGWGLHEALGAGGTALLGAGGDEVCVGKRPEGSYTHSTYQPPLSEAFGATDLAVAQH